jgi:AraC-like DNA-binding protein
MAEVSVSSRHLLRLFRENVGLTPKELARVLRLRSACLLVLGTPDRSWADLSALSGYADQAHLVREFGRLLGLTPRRAVALLRLIRHDFLGMADSSKT